MPSPRRRRRKRPPVQRRPDLTEDIILAWCDAHHARTGQWPSSGSGRVVDDVSEGWAAIDMALRTGARGLPGGTTLARLLAARRGTRNRKALPRLTEEVIVALADVHYWWTGEWPTRKSGPVHAFPYPGETWSRLNQALIKGLRGLPPGSSLARLLDGTRKVRNRKALPRLTEVQILEWADAFFARHGKWPSEDSGPIPEAPGETWHNVSAALWLGYRGFPGGSSLYKLLVKYRGIHKPGH
jgi:hypothetical protein